MAKVAVLLGGRSAERKVSLTTGSAVAAALREAGHEVREIDAAGDLCAELKGYSPDAAFIALHGRWGEDGTVQGMLEMLSIPYTGSGVGASAIAMDKALSKVMFRAAGVPTPRSQLLAPGETEAAIALPLPFVVKPPKEGSTIGISIVREASKVPEALAEARLHGDQVLVEEFVEGRELTVGVLDGEPLPIVEILPDSGFYDYRSKYTAGSTRYLCPAPLTADQARRVSEAGRAAYAALGCSGGARVDVLMDGAGEPWVIEVNTIPGMTPTSLLPKAAAAAGIDFGALCGRMLAGASLKA